MINKLVFLVFCAAVLLSLFGCKTIPLDVSSAAGKPNILLIFSDDLSYRDLSSYGQEHFSTPNLDKLAMGGMRFVNAYSGSPECAPARASLMTGMHMGHCRIRKNRSVRGQDHLLAEDVTIAEVLKQAGYATGFIGKWGIGLPGTEGTPDKQGFDYSYGYYDQLRAHSFFPHYLMRNGKSEPLPENYGFNMRRQYRHSKDKTGEHDNTYDDNGKLIPDGVKDPAKAKYSEDLFQKEAVDFIRGNKNNPFFLYYATQLPHGPCITPDISKFKDKPWDQKHKEWAAMVEHMDRGVGVMVAELERSGILDNTIILFAGDNGYSQWGYFGRKAHKDDPVFKNKGPWPKGKFTSSHEGGVRVPFFAYWKGKIKAVESEHVCSLYDILATAADLADVKAPRTDGISLVPTLLSMPDKQRKHKYLYWESGSRSVHGQSVRMDQWWAHRDHPSKSIKLYDITNDVDCLNDLAGENPKVVAKIKSVIEEAHVDSEWNINPGETKAEIKAKKQRATAAGQLQTPTRPNSIYKAPVNVDNMPEPADPDKYYMSVWGNVESGIHSGFGSIDVAYSKSIPPKGNVTESIKLQGWKGERVSCKLLVWSASSEEEVTIKSSGFSNGNHKIENERTTISVVKYVLVDEFKNERSTSCGPRDKDKVAAHISPDLLSNANSFTIGTPGTRPIWLSIDIGKGTPAGIYKGTISRQSASGTVNHAITLEVLNKVLPDPSEWSFHLDLWQNPFAVARFHGVELWSKGHIDLLRPLLTMLGNAGQKCITTTLIDKPWGDGGPCYDDFGSMIKWTRKKDGTWEYDYSVFDQYVSLAMACGIKDQINCYSMVPVGNKFTWFDEETSKTVRMETTPGTESYENLWRRFLNDFKVHLKEKGWLDITTLALDERSEVEMKSLFSFLKDTAPEFKITMAGFYHESVNSSIYDFSSNWRHTTKVSGEVMESRRKAGFKTTYYVACGIAKPNNFTFSPPSESCYEGWFAAAMGFDGFLRWAYNSWPENPVIDSRYTKWPSGDTFLIYPGPRSSVRFERLREGIADYEKIRILRKELVEKASPEAVAGSKKLNDFLNSIDSKTLDDQSADDVINKGKQLVNEIVKSVYNGQPGSVAQPLKQPDLKLLGNRFFTFSTVVRVNQIEASRDKSIGVDESVTHTPKEARIFRETLEKGWPGARMTWAFSWLALKDQRPNYRDLRKLIVSYHKKYGDEITFIPGGYFANMYNTREQVNRDLHDALQMVSDMVGGGYRPKSIIAGFLSAENLRYLAEEEGIHVCQGSIWSQYAIDNGDGEGSISYPYYPSREHFCKPAQSKDDFIDCVNLDGWTMDFLSARFAGGRDINGQWCGSRQGVGPIETVIRLGTERGTKEMLAVTAAHFDKGFELNNFAWVTCIWEMSLVEARKIYGYKGRNGMDGMVIWLSEMRRRWPDAKCITLGEFGMLWREQFKNNDDLNYRFVQRGTGVCGSEPELEIRWFMNKDFRMALLRNWQKNTPEKVIDFTRYDLKAVEPADPEPGQHSRNWSLMNRLNQKGTREQDKPILIDQLDAEDQAMIFQRYPEFISVDSEKQK